MSYRPAFARVDSYVGTPLYALDLSAKPAGPYTFSEGDLAGGSMSYTGTASTQQYAWTITVLATADWLSNLAGSSTYLFHATVGGQEFSLRMESSTNWTLTFGSGSLTISAPESVFAKPPVWTCPSNGQLFKARIFMVPLTGLFGVMFEVNGCAWAASSTTYTGSTGTCTALTIGSKQDGTHSAAIQVQRFESFHPSAATLAPAVRIAILGEAYAGTIGGDYTGSQGKIPWHSAWGAWFYTATQAAAFACPPIACLGTYSSLLTEQTTALATWAAGVRGGVHAVICAGGADDPYTVNSTTGQMAADMAAQLVQVATSCPRASAFVGFVNPFNAFAQATPTRNATLAAYNALVAAGIAGAAGYVRGNYDALNDGSGNLGAIYDTGSPSGAGPGGAAIPADHAHANDLGQQQVAAAFRAALAAAGLL